MLKKYNNSHIGIPRINRRLRRLLIAAFPEVDKCRRKHNPLRLLEAIFYILRTGCQWRLLPPCYPHWKSVYNKWRYLVAKGILQRIHSFLVIRARVKVGRPVSPSICFIDSASRRNGLADTEKGVDGFKKIKGVKRHIVVDSQGNILHVHTTGANVNDGKTALDIISDLTLKYPTLREMRADKGYQGEEISRVAASHGLILRCTKSNGGGKLFLPAHGRWVVERTFSWLDNFRRLARNYERHCRTASNMVLTAEIYRLLRFL